MATAINSPAGLVSGTPSDRVTLRAASIATPLPPRRPAIIAARESSLAAALGSNAGSDENSTSRDRDTKSSRVTSPERCSSASRSRAALAISPRSSLTSATRNALLSSTTGVSSRMRRMPVSTILLHSARLPLMAVWSSC